MTKAETFFKGFWKENPTFRLVLGMCPTLAVSTAAVNGLGMGLATTFVLVCSNAIIALIRGIIPRQVRIPAFIVVIASFVTVVDMVMAAFFWDMHKTLGLFIPLIVVNCIILGRAEAFASRHPVGLSILDGLGMGLGFTSSLIVLGAVRELLGDGAVFGISVVGSGYQPFLLFLLPPGAFIALGSMLAAMNRLDAFLSGKKS